MDADADQIYQVFMNLFVNAQHALTEAPRPRELRIRVRPSSDEHSLRVDVSDSGPGIPSELRFRIVDSYFTTTPVGKGTGVGLFVSLGIVEAHHSTLVRTV